MSNYTNKKEFIEWYNQRNFEIIAEIFIHICTDYGSILKVKFKKKTECARFYLKMNLKFKLQF